MRVRMAAAVGAIALAAPAAAQAEDIVVTSFDGTAIVGHWFPSPARPAGQTAPVVLNGPGWSQPGADDPSRGTIKQLHDQGYHVLTWDPRGFGRSGGEATIDAPDVEGRDTMALVDWTARQPAVQLDGPGDPRVGMVGGSYGGGIQYSTASIDPRIDALVPTVGWHSLRSSLYKDQTFKQGWNSLLYAIGFANGRLDPHITSAYEQANATGRISAGDEAWFVSRGPGTAALSRIEAPTLVVGGTIDTLFPLDEDVRIYRALKRAGTPVKMVWACAGHGACLKGNGGLLDAPDLDVGSLERATNDGHPDELTAAWLARHLEGDRTVDTGPEFEARSDDGRYYTASSYPPKRTATVRARGKGRLRIAPGAESGTAIAATPVARGAIEVPVRVRRGGRLLGAPKVTLTYRGKGSPGDTRVFAQLVNVARGVVVGNQATPIPVVLDGRRHTITRELVPIVSTARRGARYELQLIAGTKVWATQRTTGTLTASRIDVRLPLTG